MFFLSAFLKCVKNDWLLLVCAPVRMEQFPPIGRIFVKFGKGVLFFTKTFRPDSSLVEIGRE